MKLFRLSLRDLLWLVLLVATLTAGGLAHCREAKKIKPYSSFFVQIPRVQLPTKEDLANRALREEVAGLSNEALLSRKPKGQHEYDYWLSELARRKQIATLAAHHKAVAEEILPHDDWDRHDLEALIALRRAQGQRDPMTIRVRVDEEDKERPCLLASLENVDAEQAEFVVRRGMDDRGGRHERWNMVLIDATGKRMAYSNYRPYGGGGVGTIGPLKYGEVDRGYWFDMRTYVAPPPSGIYEVQLFYHDVLDLGPPRDLEGLIYSQSPPLKIRVRNHEQTAASLVGTPLIAGGTAMLFLGGICVVARRAPAGLWRDAAWCGLVVTASLIWCADQYRLQQQIRENLADIHANWTIEAVQE